MQLQMLKEMKRNQSTSPDPTNLRAKAHFFSGTRPSGAALGERDNPKAEGLWLKYSPEDSWGSRLDCGSPMGTEMVGIPVR